MLASTHIVPCAAISGMREFLTATQTPLALPGLRALLTTHALAPSHWLRLPEDSFTTPYEQALLQTAWPHAPWPKDGPPVSLAAWVAAQNDHTITANTGWALMAPTHLHITTDSIALLEPSGLALSAEHNAQLRDAVQSLWAEDGLELFALPNNGQWLAKAEWLQDLALPSLERAINRDVRAWMPELSQTKTLQRLQTEAQMLLYNHPVNDVRAAQRLPAINALWVWGTGTTPATAPTHTPQAPTIHLHEDLRTAALRGDYYAWHAAWQTLDQQLLAALQDPLRQHAPVTLILAGEHQAVTLTAQPPTLWGRLAKAWAHKRGSDPALALLEQL